jgi:hypothetical protein
MTYKVTMLVTPINRSSVLLDKEIEESFQLGIENNNVTFLAHEIDMGHALVEDYQVERIS